jgi:hypothetical protein
VTEYEDAIVADIKKKREAAKEKAKFKKRPAAADGGKGKPGRPKAKPAGAPKKDHAAHAVDKEALGRKHPVNIREIKSRATVDSCSKDAFLRKGWEIGKKLAVAKGLDPLEVKALASIGYAKAQDYFNSL